MKIPTSLFEQLLNDFDLKQLFNEMGWGNPNLRPQTVSVEGQDYTLTQVAQNHGVGVFQCSADANGRIPQRAVLLKIDREVTKIAHEHLLVFADQNQTTLTWLWVLRAPGQPTITRTHTWRKGQSGESLRQKLEQIVWSLEEEEAVTLTDVITGLKRAFDRDQVSKRFYDKFKAQHDAFAKFIVGLKDTADQAWYASLMLNRLMFVYFIQKKGFLDGDENYLANRMAQVQAQAGKDQFHSFYRQFLRRLFHEGLGQPKAERDASLAKLIGDVPYLNGGLFAVHELEEANDNIDVSDDAFEHLFAFFDAWDWHLDDRPLSSGKEINPDVLGYIFEKYINQKQMGAYYTKEDITEYISKTTVIPFLLEQTRERCKVAFDGPTAVWNLLKNSPERYLHSSMKKGVVSADGKIVSADLLPDYVQANMHDAKARLFDRRYNLGEVVLPVASAEQEILPTETWREYVERRNRCLALRDKLKRGDVTGIDDMTTLNLDVRQFMQDLIETCTSPDLLRAVWQSIVGRMPENAGENFRQGITILDPTCGSGAFLFAALNVLEPLYEACLDRMDSFVEDAKKLGKPGEADFESVLAEVDKHPSRRYYIYKSIILHNLFGVDIMAEAVEICKLRLFLKLVSQVDGGRGRDLEPLPDIDFNIRTGNTLIGYATEAQFDATNTLASDQVRRADIKTNIAGLASLFDHFRDQQTVHGGKITTDEKHRLRDKLADLSLDLDKCLARDYGVDPTNKVAFDAWRESHQPFHWFAEFYDVMHEGGFDVVIGNPPYVVNTPSKVHYELTNAGLTTLSCGNLYAYVFERSILLGKLNAPISLIVQLTAISSERMRPLQDLLVNRGLLQVLPYPRRPESIFDGVEMPVVILSSYPRSVRRLVSTRVGRMYGKERPYCLETHRTSEHQIRLNGHRIGKLHTDTEAAIVQKITRATYSTGLLVAKRSDYLVFYQEACRYWLKAQAGLPFFSRNGEIMRPPHGRVFCATSKNAAAFFGCLLNSSLFYWYYSLFSDCEHVNDDLVKTIPIPPEWADQDWIALSETLGASLALHANRKTIKTKQGHTIEYDEMKAARAKAEIDQADLALGRLYDLSDNELDHIVNYDIKYRMAGVDDGDEE